jgi:2-succinyl-5-enolpyruvyl-6-hydroxy-3-cyclohexene-1-carboxylate synthase
LVHYDERAAAYAGVGFGRCGMPAAVICTSGTAVANCFPAVLEAYQSSVPLAILSADRPPELQECGANQTMDQHALFGKHVRAHITLPCPDSAVPAESLLTSLDAAVARMGHVGAGGPIHINCMYREPLVPPSSPDFSPSSYLDALHVWKSTGRPFTCWHTGSPVLTKEQSDELLELIQSARHGLLVTGRLNCEAERNAVQSLALQLGWPVFADMLSGCRNKALENLLIGHYDLLLLSSAFRRLCKPDIVLYFGDELISQRLRGHLKEVQPLQIHIAERRENRDPAHQAAYRYCVDIAQACAQIPAFETNPKLLPLLMHYRNVNALVENHLDQQMRDSQQTDEIIIARLLASLADRDDLLFIGNSMPVRDMDMMAGSCNASWVFANRGVSGIDGNIATAAGIAMACNKTVIALLGDMAVLHDLNTFGLLAKTGAPVIMVVVNNSGGGIFSFLPVAQYPGVLESCFINAHSWNFKQAAEMFGLPHTLATDASDLRNTVHAALKNRKPCIIEISVDRNANVASHKRLDKELISLLDAALEGSGSMP